MWRQNFSSSLMIFPPSVPSTLSPSPPLPPPPRSLFGLPPYVELLGLVFIFLLFIVYFFLLKLICTTYESDNGEFSETVEIEAPVFIYGGDDDDGGEKECVICLCRIEGGEKCRRMSTCGHVFHRDCIDRWLKVERHCPLCRSCVCVVVDRDENTTASSSSECNPNLLLFLNPLG